MQVLLLDSDRWRYLGISRVLEKHTDITLLGEADYTRILSLTSPPPHLRPDVVIVAHALTLSQDLDVLAHLQRIFPEAQLLVDGYDDTLDGIAEVLRAGAKGYFQLSSDPSHLVKALEIVRRGYIWAPRAVVSLLVGEGSSGGSRSREPEVTPQELAILKLLQQGLRNKEIGRTLGIAEVTVKTHLTRLYRRFGVRTRLELLTYALNHRILADDLRLPARPLPEV